MPGVWLHCAAVFLANFGQKQGSSHSLSDAAGYTLSSGSEPSTSEQNYTKLALQLTEMKPREGIELLKSTDPFGVKGIRTKDDLRNIFQCRVERNPMNITRQNVLTINGSFLFYQHIQKAGGTSFCHMASAQMRKSEVGGGCRGPTIVERGTRDELLAKANRIRDECKSAADPKACLENAEGFAQLSVEFPSMQMKNQPKNYVKEQRTPRQFLAAAREQRIRIYSNEFDPFPTDLSKQPNIALVTMLRDPDQLLVAFVA